MPAKTPQPDIDRCVIDQWALQERLDALLYSGNTLSGVLAVLECTDKPNSIFEIRTRIAEHGFNSDPKTFDAISFGAVQSKLTYLADEFTLIHSYETTRPPTKGRGGRMTEIEVPVFEKDPRGHWFGDPLAARILFTCANLELSPVDIFTSAEQKGATRAPFVTANILHFLGSTGTVSQKEITTACFWEPGDRDEYNQLRSPVNNNLNRLAHYGLVDVQYNQETVFKHTGKQLETYPRLNDESRIISETDRILAYLEGRGEVRRQELINAVKTHHSSTILKHLREEGVIVRVQGGMEDRSSISLTDAGTVLVEQVINPLFQAITPGFTRKWSSEKDYNRVWQDTPDVDRGFLAGAFRDLLETYIEQPDVYQMDNIIVTRVDQERNPWR